jgi:hypothetical protein
MAVVASGLMGTMVPVRLAGIGAAPIMFRSVVHTAILW